jgi:acyl dehydratase
VNRMIERNALAAQVGREVGVSSWNLLNQDRINAFAETTGDFQFIHTDAERAARETPFGTAIAHGFLSLSLLPAMAFEAIPEIEGQILALNYGFDRIRFLTPVRVGSRVRARFILMELKERSPDETLCRYDVRMEIEGESKLAFAADWLNLILFSKIAS